jgi:hypothetical protein
MRTGSTLGGDARGIVAISERDGAIRGMLAYDGWTENACTVHLALETPAAWRRLVRPAFEAPFVEWRRGLLLCGINEHNTRSLNLVQHCGFSRICHVKDSIRVGTGMVWFQMRRENCRFLGRA